MKSERNVWFVWHSGHSAERDQRKESVKWRGWVWHWRDGTITGYHLHPFPGLKTLDSVFPLILTGCLVEQLVLIVFPLFFFFLVFTNLIIWQVMAGCLLWAVNWAGPLAIKLCSSGRVGKWTTKCTIIWLYLITVKWVLKNERNIMRVCSTEVVWRAGAGQEVCLLPVKLLR